MNEAFPVRGRQPADDLLRAINSPSRRHQAFVQTLAKLLTLEGLSGGQYRPLVVEWRK